MARLYGERFENLNPLGGGGQGDVFRVRDTSDPTGAIYALKRLKNADRCGRFLHEIAALQAINHPNVVKIVAHSGSPTPGDTSHKYWFVMPLAHDNLEDRTGIYKDNLDGVLNVAIQLADALSAAHQLGIVHRDVKPANVLFEKLDNQVWLSDFGICHLGNATAHFTEPGEVVGPRWFTAPELENTTEVHVTGGADVYSLGKVIFFMLSGGGRISREQTDTIEFKNTFDGKGQRYGLLRTLLHRMIAPIDTRIKLASEVRDELRRVQDWETEARSLALNTATLASLDAAQRKALDRVRIQAENEKVHQNEDRLVHAVTDNVLSWLKAELEKVRSYLEQDGIHKAEIAPAEWADSNRHFRFTNGRQETYIEVKGLQFTFMNPSSIFKPKFVLKFFLCKATRMMVTFGDAVTPRKAVDPNLALVPYLLELQPPDYRKGTLGGFLKNAEVMRQAHAEFVRRMGGRHVFTGEPLIAQTFVGTPVNLLTQFKASEWPASLENIKGMFSEAIKIAIDFSVSDTRSSGP